MLKMHLLVPADMRRSEILPQNTSAVFKITSKSAKLILRKTGFKKYVFRVILCLQVFSSL